MATYKVIQDIEAEDKLVGPFSFRQFVYILVGAFFGYLCFISIAKHASFLLVLFAPPMLFCFFFAWPWSPDQPTEVWALARIRFLFKPRRRIWDQSGIKEFVTITAPKRIERIYTDGLSQMEVRSRLSALANTIDSRGWAVKNVNVDLGAAQAAMPAQTDRLLDFSAMPQEVSNVDVRADDDILDEVNNPLAYQVNQMIDASTKARRQGLLARLKAAGATVPEPAAAQPTGNWFAGSAQSAAPNALPSVAVAQSAAPVPPASQPLPSPAVQRQLANTHFKTVPTTPAPEPVKPITSQSVPQPVAVKPQTQPASAPAPTPAPKPTAPQPDPAILNLAHDNNLDVATLAREAKRARRLDSSDGEVEISLR
jgi:hypothetical protein